MDEQQKIPRLKLDTQKISADVLRNARGVDREILERFQKQQTRNNDVAHVLNAQSEIIERIDETIRPVAKAMVWFAVTKWLGLCIFGGLTTLGGLILGGIELYKHIFSQ